MDKTRALIVDDSSVMRKIVERSLRQAGIDLVQVMEVGLTRPGYLCCKSLPRKFLRSC